MRRHIENYLKIYHWDLKVKDICIYKCESIHFNVVIATHFTTMLLSSVLFGILEKLAEKVVEYLMDEVLKSEQERVHIVEVNIYGSRNIVYTSSTTSPTNTGEPSYISHLTLSSQRNAISSKRNAVIGYLSLVVMILISTILVIFLAGCFSFYAGESTLRAFSRVYQPLIVGLVLGSLLGLLAMIVIREIDSIIVL